MHIVIIARREAKVNNFLPYRLIQAQAWLAGRMERWQWYRESMQHFRYEF